MNKIIIRNDLQNLIETITEQVEMLGTYEEKIPQLEIDILMDNVRKLYENLHIMNKLNDSKKGPSVKKEIPEIPEIKKPEKKAEAVKQKTAEPQSGSGIESIIEKIKKLGPEKFEDDFPRPVYEPETKDPQPEKEIELPELKRFERPVMFFQKKKSTDAPADAEPEPETENESEFGQKLIDAREKALGSSTRTGIKNSITINDKFLFINELFDGNLKEYNKNIEILDDFTDLKSGFDFLEKLRQENRWDMKGKGFKRLMEIVAFNLESRS